MTTWNPSQYLRFSEYRERPFDELVARIPVPDATRVVDLGCGPGTATTRLVDRWPMAEVLGVDSSPAMIDRARQMTIPGRLRFELGDARTWSPRRPVDVIVSNAMLQWVPDHEDLLEHLLAAVVPGGVVAFQVPANFDTPIHTALWALVSSGRWTIPTEGLLRTRSVLPPAGYLRLLMALGAEADVWETTYLQVLTGPDPVLEWARGTALRPVLSALAPDDVATFEAEYAAVLRAEYPPDAEGRTVLPFRRIFAIARRPSDQAV
jgi:trans-aconitate 2-methyltransferase